MSRPCYQRVMYTLGSAIMGTANNACKTRRVRRPTQTRNDFFQIILMGLFPQARDISNPFRPRVGAGVIRHLQLRMSLPLLVGGSAECGPSANNPLRGLAKNFDKDRGAQQVSTICPRFGPARPPNVPLYPGSFGPKPPRAF